MSKYELMTYSGTSIDFDNPRPVDIKLEDIAGALSKVCRFGAQAKHFYSVAEHAVYVSRLVHAAEHPELELAALHHDSHEAYACDIPTPLKEKMRAANNLIYDQTCDKLDQAIATHFGFSPLLSGNLDYQIMKIADNQAFVAEARLLLHDGGSSVIAERDFPDEILNPPLGVSLPFLDAPAAEELFLETHYSALERFRK